MHLGIYAFRYLGIYLFVPLHLIRFFFCLPIGIFVKFVFRPGSVVAEFELLFKTRLGDKQALAPLKYGIEDGKMGSLRVYPDSLKIIEEVEGNCK